MPPKIKNYQVKESIGQGGYAIIYLAQRNGRTRKVAIKMLPANMVGNLESEKALQREGEMGLLLNGHPNVIKTLESGTCDDGPFIALEYMEGETLRARMREKITEVDCVRIGRHIGRALIHLHKLKIFHQDVKPDNIFMTGSKAILFDFGLSFHKKIFSFFSKPSKGGSPSYIAPERLLNKPMDGRADLYSLGITLYELMAGKTPYVGFSTQEIIRKHVSEKPTALSNAARGINPVLNEVVMRCLEKDPAKRFAHAGEFLLALKRHPYYEMKFD